MPAPALKLGVDHSRADGVDLNAAGSQLDGQDLGEGHNGCLGRAVSPQGGRGLLGRNGGDINDLAPFPAGGHRPRHSLGAEEGPGGVDGQGLVPGRFLHREQRGRPRGTAGIVHQDVDAAEGIQGLGNHLVHKLTVGHIHPQRQPAHAQGADLLGSALQALPRAQAVARELLEPVADVSHRYIGPVPGQLEGYGPADAQLATGPGDDSYLSLQVVHPRISAESKRR